MVDITLYISNYVNLFGQKHTYYCTKRNTSDLARKITLFAKFESQI